VCARARARVCLVGVDFFSTADHWEECNARHWQGKVYVCHVVLWQENAVSQLLQQLLWHPSSAHLPTICLHLCMYGICNGANDMNEVPICLASCWSQLGWGLFSFPQVPLVVSACSISISCACLRLGAAQKIKRQSETDLYVHRI